MDHNSIIEQISSRRNIGDFQVEVVSAEIGKASRITMFGDTTKDLDESLLVTLRVTNNNPTKILQYQSWGTRGGFPFVQTPHRPNLVDEHNNRYFFCNKDGNSPVGSLGAGARVHPGKSVTDLLVFERPIDNAFEFTLTLPGGAVEGSKTVEFSIPRKFIK